MKKVLPIYIVLALFALVSCRSNESTSQTPRGVETPLPRSMKGYELYSWQVENEWYFTLITGTNRLKSHEEITSDEDVVSDDGWVKITVRGVDSLKAALRRLPKGEKAFWIGEKWLEQVGQTEMGGLAFPSQEVIDDIEAYCDELGLRLNVDE